MGNLALGKTPSDIMTSFIAGESHMANNALNQKLKPSAKLQEILGTAEPLSRAEAVKRLWDYVKEHKLQNPENRREILADEKLKPLFEKNKITMFEVGKVINANLEAGNAATTRNKKVA
jgi:upstream activation factor subunit UAF30